MHTDEVRITLCVKRRLWLFVLLLATWVLHVNYVNAPPIDLPLAASTVHATDAPATWPLFSDNCVDLPRVFIAVAVDLAGEYVNASLVQLADPNPGAELNVIGLVMSIVRYNMSVLAFTIEHAWLRGCDGDMRDHLSWLDILATYIPDLSSLRPGRVSSMKARFLPDKIRVDFTGVRFTVSMRYDVHHFGVHAGSGRATISGVGALWLDEISLRLAGEEHAVSIACGGDIVVEGIVFDGDYHNTEVLFAGSGIQRPDLVGYVCDGFETQNSNPFATGWQWIGPGEPAPGLRERVVGFIHTACSDPTLIERACGRCVLPYVWPGVALRLTTAAWFDDPFGFVLCTLMMVYVILCVYNR